MKQYHYERVNKPKKSSFDLSHEKKFTMNVGDLVPCYVQEIIPGDKIVLTQEMLVRNMPMIAPMMHRVNVFTHFFYVPSRLLCDDFDEMISNVSIDAAFPALKGLNSQFKPYCNVGSLADYMGLPVDRIQNVVDGDQYRFNIMPFNAYQKIYNDYYMDQNLDSEAPLYKMPVDYDFSSGAAGVLQLRKRNLEKDYFTSSLPTPQYGDPVTLPLGNTAPVTGTVITQITSASDTPAEFNATTGALQGNNTTAIVSGLTADLTLATATSVSDLRRAYALQRYQEKLMRGGKRFVEYILNIFGVNIPDSRIQRAEYLGGGKVPLQISEVIQTYGSSDTENPLGNLGGHGVSGGEITGFNKYFYEHGFVIGIMSIMPKTGYWQGVPKIFLKFSPFDFYTPDFAHIGEQAILNQEIYLGTTSSFNNGTFGYTPRYAEYRDNQDTIAGEFRTTLKHWHAAKEFATAPSLNSTFIKVDANSMNRVFAVQTTDDHKFMVQTYLKILAIRCVAKFGDPY